MNSPITRRGAFALMGAAALSLTGTGALAGCGTDGDNAGAVTVGSKAFTEGVILSELYALALEDAGIQVKRSFEISGSLIHTALTSGDIDLYPEYTGTGLISVLQMAPITDPQEAYDTVKEAYARVRPHVARPVSRRRRPGARYPHRRRREVRHRDHLRSSAARPRAALCEPGAIR